MPILRVPNVMNFYTEKQSEFSVPAVTAIEAHKKEMEAKKEE